MEKRAYQFLPARTDLIFFEVFISLAVGPGKEKEWAGMEKENDSEEGRLELGTRGRRAILNPAVVKRMCVCIFSMTSCVGRAVKA